MNIVVRDPTEDWNLLDTLTLIDCDSFNQSSNVAHFSMKVVEGLTSTGDVVEVAYCALGDYVDRWVDAEGTAHDIIYWRPVRG